MKQIYIVTDCFGEAKAAFTSRERADVSTALIGCEAGEVRAIPIIDSSDSVVVALDDYEGEVDEDGADA